MPAADEGSSEDRIHDCVHRVFQQVAGTACTGECFSFRTHRFFRKVDSGNDSGIRKGGESGHSHSAIQHLLQSPAIRWSMHPVNVGDLQEDEEEKDVQIQQVMLDVRKKFGKNAMFRGMDLEECATTRERNNQIGGHKRGNGGKEADAQSQRSL